jgi:hypothetical protein
MNSIEEKLWNYIDGNCTPQEQLAIDNLIASDEAYRIKYEELLSFNQEITAMELEEPPMAFTYNVMETIRAENASKPLKATINKHIIFGIAAFFAITITTLLIYSLATIKWTASGAVPFNLGANAVDFKVSSAIRIPELKNYLTRPVIEGFLFFEVIFGLFFFDAWLRKVILGKLYNSMYGKTTA